MLMRAVIMISWKPSLQHYLCLIQDDSNQVTPSNTFAYAKLFLAKFYQVIGNLYPYTGTKFWEFMLKFNELWVHFSRVPQLLLFKILSVAVRFCLHQQ